MVNKKKFPDLSEYGLSKAKDGIKYHQNLSIQILPQLS